MWVKFPLYCYRTNSSVADKYPPINLRIIPLWIYYDIYLYLANFILLLALCFSIYILFYWEVVGVF